MSQLKRISNLLDNVLIVSNSGIFLEKLNKTNIDYKGVVSLKEGDVVPNIKYDVVICENPSLVYLEFLLGLTPNVIVVVNERSRGHELIDLGAVDYLLLNNVNEVNLRSAIVYAVSSHKFYQLAHEVKLAIA